MAAREMRVTRENFILIEFGGGVAEGLLDIANCSWTAESALSTP